MTLVATLTTVGRAALVDADTGGTAAIVIAKAGLTSSVFVAAPTLTALPGEFKRIDAIAGIAVDPTTLHLVVRDSGDAAYTVRGLALYLADGTLFATIASPVPILSKADVSTFYLAVDLQFLDGVADNITFGNTNFLNPPAGENLSGVASLATVAEALVGAVNDKIITPATMHAVLASYVAADRLGVPDGVATLGPDGKLLVSQRPPIDLIDVFPVANQAAMLALAATVGDFAVRTDNGLVYVLQATPATTLANWLEISTPAPVSSVNGKVGAVVLSAADVGAVPTARTITGSGLATGGGAMSGNRTIDVAAASEAEAEAAAINTKALTPLSIASIVARLDGKVAPARAITGAGLVTGGGDLSADRVLSVAAATSAEILAGIEAGKAITPFALAGLPKSLTPNGFVMEPSGLIWQWIQYRQIWTSESAFSINWPTPFPNAYLVASATGWLQFSSIDRNIWPQVITPNRFGGQIQLQNAEGKGMRIDGIDILVVGF